MRFDPHARWRELLAARLDRPLTRAENRLLISHLKGCAGCRQVEHDYREQSALLRSLPTPQPPRDMWARTSTALDHEMSRRALGYPRIGRRRVVRAARSGAPSAIATVVAALGVVTALVALQLVPALRSPGTNEGTPAGTTVALRPTPFSVPAESLALVSTDASDLTFYDTHIDLVCPITAPDCLDSKFVERRLEISSDVRPQNATLSAAGRVAFVGHNKDRDVIAVVLLSTDATPPERTAAPTPTVEPTPTATERSAQPGTPKPTATDSPSGPLGSPTATPSADSSSEPTPSDSPNSTPDSTPTEQPTETTGTASPEVTPAVVVEETPTPVVADSFVPDPLATAVAAEMKVVSILENVRSVGAPPAWSRDGEVLAFSAMPVDASQGPDVYVWQPGDDEARAITTDHASYFASWSGRRVAVSKLTTETVVTSVIDPGTLEERLVQGPVMWLPAVDAQRTRAIAWHGTIDLTQSTPSFAAGELYMVDWAALNPFRADDGEAPSDSLVDVELVPLDPARDPLLDPVVDWQARWSTDGRVLGIWEAETSTESWGDLILVAIDETTGAVNIDDPLLPPKLAKRGFALGSDRVAWIGPPEDGTEGDLRIRTWGIDGVGDLRIQPVKPETSAPAI